MFKRVASTHSSGHENEGFLAGSAVRELVIELLSQRPDSRITERTVSNALSNLLDLSGRVDLVAVLCWFFGFAPPNRNPKHVRRAFFRIPQESDPPQEKLLRVLAVNSAVDIAEIE